ncbi:MAG: MFS transporter, partial [Candidatus Pacebacteria bacterium]|nr:MFS transporter [Candidatus Paceibacterota bacterium]
FIINIPLGIIGLFLALNFIDESVGEKRAASFDWWGSITLAVALFGLTIVLDQGQTWGWGSATSIFWYLTTIVFSFIFYNVEMRQKEPIVNLEFFKIPLFVNTLANNFIVFMGLIGSIFLIPIFAQTFLGYDATQTGYLFIPLAIAMMGAAPLGGRLMGRVKPSTVIFASTVVAAIGMFGLSYIDARSTAIDIIIPMFIMAFGLGFGMAQRTNLVAVAVPHEDIGEASAILALVRNISGAFGTAIFSTLLLNATNTNVLAIARESFLNGSGAQLTQEFISLITLKAQVSAYATVFQIASVVVLIGAFAAFLIRTPAEVMEDGKEVMILD